MQILYKKNKSFFERPGFNSYNTGTPKFYQKKKRYFHTLSFTFEYNDDYNNSSVVN